MQIWDAGMSNSAPASRTQATSPLSPVHVQLIRVGMAVAVGCCSDAGSGDQGVGPEQQLPINGRLLKLDAAGNTGWQSLITMCREQADKGRAHRRTSEGAHALAEPVQGTLYGQYLELWHRGIADWRGLHSSQLPAGAPHPGNVMVRIHSKLPAHKCQPRAHSKSYFVKVAQLRDLCSLMTAFFLSTTEPRQAFAVLQQAADVHIGPHWHRDGRVPVHELAEHQIYQYTADSMAIQTGMCDTRCVTAPSSIVA